MSLMARDMCRVSAKRMSCTWPADSERGEMGIAAAAVLLLLAEPPLLLALDDPEEPLPPAPPAADKVAAAAAAAAAAMDVVGAGSVAPSCSCSG